MVLYCIGSLEKQVVLRRLGPSLETLESVKPILNIQYFGSTVINLPTFLKMVAKHSLCVSLKWLSGVIHITCFSVISVLFIHYVFQSYLVFLNRKCSVSSIKVGREWGRGEITVLNVI